MELEKSNQETKRLEKESQREVGKRKKSHPDRRFTISATSHYSVSPIDGLERRIAKLENYNEELRNENDQLRRDRVSSYTVYSYITIFTRSSLTILDVHVIINWKVECHHSYTGSGVK